MPHRPSHHRLPILYSKRGSCNEPPRSSLHLVPNSVWTKRFPGEGYRGCTGTGRVSCDCHNYDGCRGNLGVCLERKIDHALRDVDILLTVCSRKKQTECLKQ